MIQAETLQAGELAALLHFYADAGVDTLLEEDGIDRFAEFAEAKAAARPAAPARDERPSRNRTEAAPQRAPAKPVTVPGDEAIAAARKAAEAASSIAELHAAASAFDACNLKNSARNTVFPKEAGTLPVLLFGPAPSAEDDREGEAFTGAHGDLLSKMFAAIGVDCSAMTLAHAIPWRPPGGRPPTPAEAEICRPFAERLLVLAKPRFVILMGNFTARFFTGSQDSIHALRGQWQKIEAGGQVYEAMPMLHPQDLISAPASKRLAWEDLLAFEDRLRS